MQVAYLALWILKHLKIPVITFHNTLKDFFGQTCAQFEHFKKFVKLKMGKIEYNIQNSWANKATSEAKAVRKAKHRQLCASCNYEGK